MEVKDKLYETFLSLTIWFEIAFDNKHAISSYSQEHS